jgi:hypothetical protein
MKIHDRKFLLEWMNSTHLSTRKVMEMTGLSDYVISGLKDGTVEWNPKRQARLSMAYENRQAEGCDRLNENIVYPVGRMLRKNMPSRLFMYRRRREYIEKKLMPYYRELYPGEMFDLDKPHRGVKYLLEFFIKKALLKKNKTNLKLYDNESIAHWYRRIANQGMEHEEEPDTPH